MSTFSVIQLRRCPATRLEANLTRLCDDLVSCPKPITSPSLLAVKLAKTLPLSHATSERKVLGISESGSFESMATLISEGILKHRPECAEVALAATNAVFFYVGPFSYPATIFGFLYSSELETGNRQGGRLFRQLRRPKLIYELAAIFGG
jgi:hypothetical protein